MKLEEMYKERIALKTIEFIKEGQIINLGIGIPTLVANFIPKNFVYLHTENGMLGVGPAPLPGEEDKQIVNAGKKPVTETLGVSYFDSEESFSMIRGKHVDVAILGALQISETGDIANWAVPGASILGVGGAMDLVMGAKQVIVTTTHTTKNGQPKILPKCEFALTAKEEVDYLITEYAIFRFQFAKMVLMEISDFISLERLKEITPAHYEISNDLKIWPSNGFKEE